MYDIDYDEIAIQYCQGNLLSTGNKSEWKTVECRYGWEYDHTDYDSTLVTEVTENILFLIVMITLVH